MHYEDIPAQIVEMDGVKGVTIRWLVSKKDGAPNFAMRQFTLDPGGYTPHHSHDWEHEVYILSGTGSLFVTDKTHHISPGSAAFIPPGAQHQFLADNGEELVFLCMIPNHGR